ncbi:unnamed protein product [Rotaria sp. Silwood2]|nr:unnamed protein product [Rotaria sp. Silwood2]CAF3139096.1 unnamed protein product [Rotaria sp. Silwood2]CAF3349303.1 unnamed protein product [Rotaria sp. Silwood2]CAF3363700.1 unnamed protein product [Rotaria sp. Silwood2]CAF4303327.1 unnamed protein product [Rotaria sp. Silwood2]
MSSTSTSSTNLNIKWHENWAFNCDFSGNDLTHIQISGESCGTRCAQTPRCSHYAWTTYKHGTCWLKQGQISKKQAVEKNDNGNVCGVVGPYEQISNEYPIISNIFATHYLDNDSDGCALPVSHYTISYPVALGNIMALKYLKFRPELCGQVLTINCGHGSLDTIVTNSKPEGGLLLYTSTWNKLIKNNKTENVSCSVQLQFRNVFESSEPRCYYKLGTITSTTHRYKIGILNTYGRIVSEATIDNQSAHPRGANSSYAFDFDFVDMNKEVIFTFENGMKNSFRLEECLHHQTEQIWS